VATCTPAGLRLFPYLCRPLTRIANVVFRLGECVYIEVEEERLQQGRQLIRVSSAGALPLEGATTHATPPRPWGCEFSPWQ
jgi:hypothetical protein